MIVVNASLAGPRGSTVRLALRVRSYEAGPDDRLCPSGLLHWLQEVAVQGSGAFGFNQERYAEMGKAWVLRCWRILVERWPGVAEEVTAETWVSGMLSVRSQREFLLRDAEGRDLVRAQAEWVFMDRATRRPGRIVDELRAAFRARPEQAVAPAVWDSLPADGAAAPGVPEAMYAVRRSDLDSWDHANNAAYVDWCLDALPSRTAATLCALRVDFRRELRWGEELRVRTRGFTARRDGAAMEGYDQAVVHAGSDQEAARVMTWWRMA